jgi:YfiH family protein
MTLNILTSDALAPVNHGFFTRSGGASTGIFAGLNCGYGSSDQREAVALNRQRVAEVFDLDAAALVSLHQHHSPDVLVLNAAPEGPPPKADAMVTSTRGIGLGVLTADCQPVLFADVQAGVIGAAHAGWKGAVGGVLEATLDAMEGLGADRANIVATIGPCIRKVAYEVGPEFFEAVCDADPERERYFHAGAGDRMHFDLPRFGVDRLVSAGIGQASWTGHCTYTDPELFFSYRRSVHNNEADYGRLISVITL